MTRLDQLAQPKRRNGEHISAIIERERRQALELENLSRLSLSRASPADQARRKSRSMSQLANGRAGKSRDNSRASQDRFKSSALARKHDSMTQLASEETATVAVTKTRKLINARAAKVFSETGVKTFYNF